nr:HD domain-containing protein 2 isoform X2 [Ipomoea batatas]
MSHFVVVQSRERIWMSFSSQQQGSFKQMWAKLGLQRLYQDEQTQLRHKFFKCIRFMAAILHRLVLSDPRRKAGNRSCICVVFMEL